MKLVKPWSKVICPYCCHGFHLSEAARRSLLTTAAIEKDQALGDFLQRPAPDLPKVEPPPKGNLFQQVYRRCVVHDDGGQNYKKVCPKCHIALPHKTSIGEVGNEFFAIIGARNSGKSNFFGVLLNSLEKRYSDDVGFIMFDQETLHPRTLSMVGSSIRYRERYHDRLFSTGMAIDQTQTAAVDVETRIPLIYRLEFPKRPYQYVTRPLRRVNAIHMVIFDTAGEDMNDPTKLEQFYRFIAGASGIIFLIDPFQYAGFRDQLDPSRQKRFNVGGDPADIVARVIDLFEKRARLKSGAKIKVPVVFAFTKSDMLKGIVEPNSAILKDSLHQGGFNTTDFETVSEEVTEYIRQTGNPQLVNLARSRFQAHAFSAVSALGDLPDEKLQLSSTITPLRIADPILWLLWKRGYIRSMK